MAGPKAFAFFYLMINRALATWDTDKKVPNVAHSTGRNVVIVIVQKRANFCYRSAE